MMFGLGRKKPVDFDAAIASIVDAALEMADGLMSCAPTDKPVEPEELRRVEAFVAGTLANRLQDAWSEHGIAPAAVALFGKPLEDRFRASFAKRFYASAPLAQMRNEGQA